MYTKLSKRIDLEKMTQVDHLLSGTLRLSNAGSYNNWKIFPEFKKSNSKRYRAFDLMIPPWMLHKNYGIIVQTPESSDLIAKGEMCIRGSDISISERVGTDKDEVPYTTPLPIWLHLMNYIKTRPSCKQNMDVIFVYLSANYINGADLERVQES